MGGCYINVKDENKIDYLNRVGEEFTLEELLKFFSYTYKQENYPVVYFKNEHVEIAGILYNENEFRRALKDVPPDSKFFIVPLSELESVSDIEKYIL